MVKGKQAVKYVTILMAIFFLSPSVSSGQQPDTLIKKLDSLSKKTDSVGRQTNNTAPMAYTKATGLNFSSFFLLEGSNLKQAFTKPFHMTKKDWVTFGKFALATGALMLADEPVQRAALDLRTHNRSLRSTSSFITEFGGTYEGYTLLALGGYGYLLQNKKMQTTTLLAVQSYITGAAVSGVVKFLTGRLRPYIVDKTSLEAEPKFYGPFVIIRNPDGSKANNSFPSGHTTVAFAAATVYALEYKNKPLVPILSYTAATLVGLSRITENKHWITDVVAGAGLGYLSGRLVVNNYHRYASLKSPKKKGDVSFNLQYTHGVLMPGMVYRFR